VTRLALRRGTVVSIEGRGPVDELTVEVDGAPRPAIGYPDLTGPVEVGDEVIVNVAARELGLGSGGFDVVHANLTRGLEGDGPPGAHVMKLNYTSLQHAVHPAEDQAPRDLEIAGGGKPVAVIALHAQLPCVAWAAAQSSLGARIGYVQTWGGALPGALSHTVRQLRERGLLAGHVTAGEAFGGEHDAISVVGAIHAGLTGLGWDAAIVGPGPGLGGSATAFGHGGMAALESAHAALALGCPTIFVPRMSEGDPRPRHRGLSHHSATVLSLLLKPVVVALPDELHLPGGHQTRAAAADLRGYGESGLPMDTMGRGIDQDELFFRAALAGGVVLAEALNDVREDR
jgi:hypothetical protein